jgi:hypothetical protein
MPMAPVTVEVAVLNPDRSTPGEFVFIFEMVELPLGQTGESCTRLWHWITDMQQYVMSLEDHIEAVKKIRIETKARFAKCRSKKWIDEAMRDDLFDFFKRQITLLDVEIKDSFQYLRQAQADLRLLICERRRIFAALDANAELMQFNIAFRGEQIQESARA